MRRKKDGKDLVAAGREGTKVRERVQSPIEQSFLSEWWLYYQGDLWKRSLLLLHWMRLSINSGWACQWHSPYVVLKCGACICRLGSASQATRASPSIGCMRIHASVYSRTQRLRCCAWPPRNGELSFSTSVRAHACVFPATHYVLERGRISVTEPLFLSLHLVGDGKGKKGVRPERFRAAWYSHAHPLQNRRRETCARRCSRDRELSVSFFLIKGRATEGELFLPPWVTWRGRKTWGETSLQLDLFSIVV